MSVWDDSWGYRWGRVEAETPLAATGMMVKTTTQAPHATLTSRGGLLTTTRYTEEVAGLTPAYPDPSCQPPAGRRDPSVIAELGTPICLHQPVDPLDRQSWKGFGRTDGDAWYLYLLRNDSGDLLYAGITWNPFARWARHAAERDWWTSVASVDLFACATTNLARAAETWAIKNLCPVHNRHQAVWS